MMPSNQIHNKLLLGIGAITFCRLSLNTARRFVYPFAPALSRGLGVPLTAVTPLIGLAQTAGILGAIMGPLADRAGYRSVMIAGLMLLMVGTLLGGALPFFAPFFLALLLSGLAKFIFDPALQAYVGEKVPYRNRARMIGVLELSWAGSTLLGIPLIGVLIDLFGWRAPFFALAVCGLAGSMMILRLIPSDTKQRESGQRANKTFSGSWKSLLTQKPVVAALAIGFLFSAANDNLFIVYGAWLERSFGLSIVHIGLGTAVIGVAELAGELTTAAISDRIGLKRSVSIGFLLTATGYLSLALSGQQLWFAYIQLFVIFLTFEYTIVALLSLCTELAPGLRATMMSGFLAAAGIGRFVGTLIGVPVWQTGGIIGVGIVSALISFSCLVVMVWGMRGWESLESGVIKSDGA